MTFILLLIIAVILLWFIVKKTYAVQIDNTLLFTGAPGTGKTNKMVSMALKHFRKARKRVERLVSVLDDVIELDVILISFVLIHWICLKSHYCYRIYRLELVVKRCQ